MTEKIAILGGGVSALAAAYEIVKRSNPTDYDIWIYQQGWRLGGKLATGRNYKLHDRIEEHGIHVLFGSYENAFFTLRRVFDDLGINDWQDLFDNRSTFTAMERVGRRWVPWHIHLKPIDQDNGSSNPSLPGDELFLNRDGRAIPSLVDDLMAWAIANVIEHVASSTPVGAWLLRQVQRYFEGALAAASLDDMEELLAAGLQVLGRLVRITGLMTWLPGVAGKHDRARRLWIALELSTTIALGVLKAGQRNETFEDMNDLDLREWLDANAVTGGRISDMTRNSSVLNMIYELVFAYEGGDVSRPRIAAGTGLRAVLRLFLDYRGHFVWAMRDGSETIITHLYKVLVEYGVGFEFFHRVDELVASGDNISEIRMTQQAKPRGGFYEPLSDTARGGWPATPKYDDLEPGTGLDNGGEFTPPLVGKDPEYDETAARAADNVTIRAGTDFDRVIVALPPKELAVVANFQQRKWQDMLATMGTATTAAAQLWLTKDAAELGFDVQADAPTVGTYAHDFPDWIDLSITLQAEDWPGDGPVAVAYLVGTIRNPVGVRNPAREVADVKEMVRKWLINHTKVIWPHAHRGGFDWNVLYDPENRQGPARLDAQFFRMNVDRAEQYTLSLPGSMKHRLKAGEAPYDNLVLCGDWTLNGLDVGAVEAAVMSGRQAAREVLGQDFLVYGEHLEP